MGAGILPVALHKGVLFLLMGQERKNNLWCDFGGTPNKKEKPFETAIREGGEELNGFLGINEELENTIYIGKNTTSNCHVHIEHNFLLNQIFFQASG